jgi:hypothetical protein
MKVAAEQKKCRPATVTIYFSVGFSVWNERYSLQ